MSSRHSERSAPRRWLRGPVKPSSAAAPRDAAGAPAWAKPADPHSKPSSRVFRWQTRERCANRSHAARRGVGVPSPRARALQHSRRALPAGGQERAARARPRRARGRRLGPSAAAEAARRPLRRVERGCRYRRAWARQRQRQAGAVRRNSTGTGTRRRSQYPYSIPTVPLQCPYSTLQYTCVQGGHSRAWACVRSSAHTARAEPEVGWSRGRSRLPWGQRLRPRPRGAQPRQARRAARATARRVRRPRDCDRACRSARLSAAAMRSGRPRTRRPAPTQQRRIHDRSVEESV